MSRRADEIGKRCGEIEYNIIWVIKCHNHGVVQAVIGIST